ncbi:carboxymuconolactone decarboxylase family protein [Phycicoccus flavus]|uniref:carboxymuconolactone decarboxylase family protein n=1 Tax=Phycicoccus flavus TaxID=2502783 RepID=UPI000FEB7EC0|nr:carboxymuconolactone decarboxylase family protein [Phycicoccus flavus]NHA70234.1 carboxymuconolactone decarboxylase family protein [Phycicoccus flavus]
MSSTFRIPASPARGPYVRLVEAVSRRMWGQVPDTLAVYAHHLPVLKTVLGFERRVQRWHALDPHLQAYAQAATAACVGCSWCLDFGYFLAHTEGLDETKIREIPRWHDSTVFTDVERDVLAYAEAMSATPPTVDDALSHRLQDALGVPAVVELTQLVALENMRARFNCAAGLESQGFSAVCELPIALPSSS